MAKIVKKKVIKTGAKKTADKKPGVKKREKKKRTSGKRKEVTKHVATENPFVDYVDDDEELLHEEEKSITSEDEGGSDDERTHQKLLEAISALGGKRKKKLAERSEATVQMSEFTVNAEGEGDKINLSDLIQTIEKTPALPAQTKNQLKKFKSSNKTVDSPLSKPETERIQRNLAFEKTAEVVSQWQSIVRQNRRAEQLVFPLNQEASGPKPLEQIVSGWKAKTPLEQEIFRLLSVNKQPINDPVLTHVERESLKAMSLEDAKIRRAELQKARALQSYYEAKAKRERSIKSKKHHKVLNKSKRKNFVQQFDEMVKTNPVGALEELQKLELTRMKERMSLKHQNSGKWAKSKAIMAKYDDGARKAMQQQLEVNKDLTQKLVTSLGDDDDEEEGQASDAEVVPDFVNDAEPGLDLANPWMRGKLSAEATEAEGGDSEEPDARGQADAANTAEEEEEEEGPLETEEEALLRGFAARRKLRQSKESEEEPPMCVNEGVATTEESRAEEEEEEEEEELSQFTSLIQGLTDRCKEAGARETADTCEPQTSAQLEQAMFRIKNLEDMEDMEDMELLDQEEESPAQPSPAEVEAPPEDRGRKRKKKRGIDLNKVLTKEAKVIRLPVTPTAVEEAEEEKEQEEDQRDVIREAFAGDDVVSDFLKDKGRQEQAGRPAVVDLTLPGWGEWGGVGLRPSRRKHRRFRVKAAPRAPRKDRDLPSVIISETRDRDVSLLQVSALPFPFRQPEHFEATIRSPVGATWNPRQVVQKLTKPKVVTQMGAIIQPMSRDDMIKHKRRWAPTVGGTQQKKASQKKGFQKKGFQGKKKK